MRNGQLKAAYNIQMGVESEYIVGIGSYTDRTDVQTLVPFLERILTTLSDKDVITQIHEDALNLERITGHKVNGFAYLGGCCEYYNERVKELIEKHTDLYYGRTAKSCYGQSGSIMTVKRKAAS